MANETISQFSWHHKPAGWSGAPCPICGCTAKRLRAEHRATKFGETWARYPWIKRVTKCFGLDSDIEGIKV